MSVVISFRLNPENTREASALAMILTWQKRGYSIRHIMTEALLEMGNGNIPHPDKQTANLNKSLEEIYNLLYTMSNNPPMYLEKSEPGKHGKQNLSDNFIEMIKVAAKPGLDSKG